MRHQNSKRLLGSALWYILIIVVSPVLLVVLLKNADDLWANLSSHFHKLAEPAGTWEWALIVVFVTAFLNHKAFGWKWLDWRIIHTRLGSPTWYTAGVLAGIGIILFTAWKIEHGVRTLCVFMANKMSSTQAGMPVEWQIIVFAIAAMIVISGIIVLIHNTIGWDWLDWRKISPRLPTSWTAPRTAGAANPDKLLGIRLTASIAIVYLIIYWLLPDLWAKVGVGRWAGIAAGLFVLGMIWWQKGKGDFARKGVTIAIATVIGLMFMPDIQANIVPPIANGAAQVSTWMHQPSATPVVSKPVVATAELVRGNGRGPGQLTDPVHLEPGETKRLPSPFGLSGSYNVHPLIDRTPYSIRDPEKKWMEIREDGGPDKVYRIRGTVQIRNDGNVPADFLVTWSPQQVS